MVMGTYDVFPTAVLHGGTAIWRCYGGNRFSEDVDFYLPPSERGKSASLSVDFQRKGLPEQKLRETPNSVLAKFGSGPSAVRFEATFRRAGGAVVRRYEMLDGSFAAVRTLSAGSLLEEKALAYLGRRKVRDLYDVFYLVQVAEDAAGALEPVRRLVRSFRAPADGGNLRATVITGSVPTVAEMREEIELWAR